MDIKTCTVCVSLLAPTHKLNILPALYKNISQGKKMASIIQGTRDLKIKEENAADMLK